MIPELTTKRAEIEALCRKLGVKRLDVFGSAATGDFKPETSDLDFLVEFEDNAKGPGYAHHYFDLKDALEALFDRHVDLVVSSAIRNPYFRASAERSRVQLYAA